MRGVDLHKVRAQNTRCAVFLRGLKNVPIHGVRMTDCVFENAAQCSIVENARDISLEAVRVIGKPEQMFAC